MERIQEIIELQKNMNIENKQTFEEYKKIKDIYYNDVIFVLNKYKIDEKYEGYYHLVNVLIYMSYSLQEETIIPSIRKAIEKTNISNNSSHKVVYNNILLVVRKYISNDRSVKSVLAEITNKVLERKTGREHIKRDITI